MSIEMHLLIATMPAAANDCDPLAASERNASLSGTPGPAVDGLCHFEVGLTEARQPATTHPSAGDWRWRLCSADGAVLCECEGFRSRDDCLRAIVALRQQAASATIRLLS
jgi:uncharacterized protein YegP (UPF0339 family)